MMNQRWYRMNMHGGLLIKRFVNVSTYDHKISDRDEDFGNGRFLNWDEMRRINWYTF